MPKLLTTEEVATMLRWTPRYIGRLARERKIPAIKLGREWRYYETEIIEWIAQGRPSPEEQPSLFDRVDTE